jgi:hypothetical protein
MKTAVKEVPKKPDEALLNDLRDTTYLSERELGKSEEIAKRIADRVVRGFENTWIFFAAHPSNARKHI